MHVFIHLYLPIIYGFVIILHVFWHDCVYRMYWYFPQYLNYISKKKNVQSKFVGKFDISIIYMYFKKEKCSILICRNSSFFPSPTRPYFLKKNQMKPVAVVKRCGWWYLHQRNLYIRNSFFSYKTHTTHWQWLLGTCHHQNTLFGKLLMVLIENLCLFLYTDITQELLINYWNTHIPVYIILSVSHKYYIYTANCTALTSFYQAWLVMSFETKIGFYFIMGYIFFSLNWCLWPYSYLFAVKLHCNLTIFFLLSVLAKFYNVQKSTLTVTQLLQQTFDVMECECVHNFYHILWIVWSDSNQIWFGKSLGEVVIIQIDFLWHPKLLLFI